VIDKLRIAERLDAFGVHYIEGGWPGSNPKDIEFFEEAKRRTFRHARLAAFGATRRKGIGAEDDDQVRTLVAAETPVVTIVGKTWLLHVKEVLQTTPEENLAMIEDTVRYLKSRGRFVVYDAEHSFDGYKDEPEYALATLQAAERGGADVVVLCDTNGGSIPDEVAGITRAIGATLKVAIGIHTHDDIGLGVANALAALQAGATHVQGTINGIGERTGNCNLTSVVPNLAFKYRLESVPPDSLVTLKELSQFVDEIANMNPNPRLPWVGAAAFSHKGGQHVNAVQKLVRSYEHIDPALVGNSRHVLMSELAGRSNIVMKAYHVSMRSAAESSICEATVKVVVGRDHAHTVADGDGPVNALDGALRSALLKFYPELQAVRLTDYKVRIVNSSSGTAAVTRVLIESTDGMSTWTTVGVHENIIEASLQALTDSLEYGLLRTEFSRAALSGPTARA